MPTVITAGAVAAKISELRSTLAVYSTWIQVLRSNYMSSDAGEPESRIYREDAAPVSEAHLETVISGLEERIEALSEELAEWEALEFTPPNNGLVRLRRDPQEKKAEAKPKPKGKLRVAKSPAAPERA